MCVCVYVYGRDWVLYIYIYIVHRAAPLTVHCVRLVLRAVSSLWLDSSHRSDYIYIYIYTCMYIYVYIYIYMNVYIHVLTEHSAGKWPFFLSPRQCKVYILSCICIYI